MQRYNLALVAMLAAIGCDSADPEARSVNDANVDNDAAADAASAVASEASEDESVDWFEARLARVEVQERERLFELVALDHDGEPIGRISLSHAVDGSIAVRHHYPDGEMTVRWTRSSTGPAAGTTVVDQTLSDARITDRANLIADVYAPPQVGEASALACALTIAASGAACFATPPPWVAGTCPAGIYATVCACRSQIKKTFDFDFTVCDDL